VRRVSALLDSAKKRFPESFDTSYSTITGVTSSSAASTVSINNVVMFAYWIFRRNVLLISEAHKVRSMYSLTHMTKKRFEFCLSQLVCYIT